MRLRAPTRSGAGLSLHCTILYSQVRTHYTRLISATSRLHGMAHGVAVCAGGEQLVGQSVIALGHSLVAHLNSYMDAEGLQNMGMNVETVHLALWFPRGNHSCVNV